MASKKLFVKRVVCGFRPAMSMTFGLVAAEDMEIPERDPDSVKQDVIEGYVSPESAHEIYGVAIGETGEIDPDKTRARRARPISRGGQDG